MRGHASLRLLVLGCCWWLGTAALGPAGTVSSSNVYFEQDPASKGLVLLAPSSVFTGVFLRNLTTEGPLDCALECRNEPDCSWFSHVECESDQMDKPDPRCDSCTLYNAGCSVTPSVGTIDLAGLEGATYISGFPIRQVLPDGPGFAAQPGLGVQGNDLQCNQSVIPDRCALRTSTEALIVCGYLPACSSVVTYFNGTDGCSDPVSVLVSASITPDTSFVGPSVTTWTRVVPGDARAVTLTASEAQVVLPGKDESASTGWLGCIIAQQALMDGLVLGTLDNVQNPEACCRACRATANCTVWNYCSHETDCSYIDGPLVTNLTYQQCELRQNDIVDIVHGFPPSVVAKGPQVPFSGGSPLVAEGPQLAGYDQYPGRTEYNFGRLNCSETLRPALQECVVAGTAEEVAAKCDAKSDCGGFVLKSGWLGMGNVGVLKQYVNLNLTGYSPANVLYAKKSSVPAGSSGLSAGAIAGIAVGAAAAVLLAAVGALLLVRRRRAQRRRAAQPAAAALPGRTNGDLAKVTDSDNSLKAAESGADMGSAFHAGGIVGHSTAQTVAIDAATAMSVGVGTPSSSGGASGAAAPQRHPSTNAGPQHGSMAEGREPAPSREASSAAVNADSAFMGVAAAAARSARPPRGARGTRGVATRSVLAPAASSSQSFRGVTSSPFAAAAAARAAAAPAAAPGDAGGGGIPGSLRGGSGADGGGSASSHSSAGRSTGGPVRGSSGTAAGLDAPAPSSAAPAAMGSDKSMLPELAAHIAEVDAQIAVEEDGSHGGGARERSLLSPDLLSPGLRDWLVPLEAIQFQQWPNGALKELGSGASATVYKATFRGETVAAKEVDLGRSPEVHELFVREAERLHQLRHAHVVALYGVALSGPRGILLMEYCAGRDLQRALRLKKAGTQRRLFSWYARGSYVALELAKALNFLHSKGVVHLDVKASNVLLAGTGTAKLADVGVARLQRGTYLSDLPAAVGTFAWMAPELIFGHRCTCAVDIYSYGVVLWEIVTGEQPSRGDMRAPVVPEECPQEVVDLIHQCMSLDPTERPTAQQLMLKLESMLKSK